MGPTAVGKTEISLKLSSAFEGIFEIVSADSVQVYRYLDIGSGKPGVNERSMVVHHMIDIVDPDCPFTAGEYSRLAEGICSDIIARGKFPLFVGGTGLYIDSFFKGISEIPDIDAGVRLSLNDELREKGLDYLYDVLVSVDREFAVKIHRNDRQRILRGLEVYRSTGRPLSCYYSLKYSHESADTLFIGISEERDILRDRIDDRVDKMMASGFVDEVMRIREMGYSPDLKSMKTIGYLELNRYLDRAMSLDEAVAEIKLQTKKYAKRQMTWFRKNKSIAWFERGDFDLMRSLVQSWLEENGGGADAKTDK